VPQKRIREIYSNIPIPKQESVFKTVKDTINTQDFKYIFKAGNTHQNRKVRTKTVDGYCDTVTASDKMYLTNHEIVSEKYGFNFDVPKQELEIGQYAQLQGFPKTYKFCGSHSSKRKQIGNAVPPPLIKAFFSQIILSQHFHSTVERK
jgi:site-specific DNA-cytosine methylase